MIVGAHIPSHIVQGEGRDAQNCYLCEWKNEESTTIAVSIWKCILIEGPLGVSDGEEVGSKTGAEDDHFRAK